jgi:hypothetical protein
MYFWCVAGTVGGTMLIEKSGRGWEGYEDEVREKTNKEWVSSVRT